MGIKKQAKELKRKFVGGVGKTLAKRHLQRTGSCDSSEATGASSTSFRRMFRSSRRTRREDDDQQKRAATVLCFRNNPSNNIDNSNMLSFAVGGSTAIAATLSEEQEKDFDRYSSLYRPSASSSYESEVLHPVLCKRDIFIGDMPPRHATKASADPPGQKGIATRRAMSDVSNDPNRRPQNSNHQLPSYSISGSMLCQNMEKGSKRGTSAPQTMMSPQRPLCLPSNSIMGSMVFRSLQQEDRMLLTNGEDMDVEQKPPSMNTQKQQLGLKVPEAVHGSKSSPESSVSSVSMSSHGLYKTSNQLDMVRASGHLLALFHEKGTGLYEA